VALIRAQRALDSVSAEGEQRFGVDIIRRAIEEPLRTIVNNGGGEASITLENVRNGTGGYGYNAATGAFEDLYAAGVIDPTKVTRAALENAASVAGLLLTTEAMIAEFKDDEEAGAGGGHSH
jgi:chaperonin GroEL